MAFAAWYSFRKALPDSLVLIDVDLERPIFRWAAVSGSLARGRKSDFAFPPTVVVVRDFEGDWAVSPSKSTAQTALVDYSEGCGNFVVDEWINKNQAPFHRALDRFGTSDMTVNEVAVLKLWERCNDLYRSMGVN